MKHAEKFTDCVAAPYDLLDPVVTFNFLFLQGFMYPRVLVFQVSYLTDIKLM